MPLVILTGLPASGKTKAAIELKEFFESRGKKIKLISENEILKDMNVSKNEIYGDSKKEKELRSIIKSSFTRDISPDEITIIDGLNYIKGYRYELYCISKSAKTTQCTLYCQTSKNDAWENNLKNIKDQYSKEIFDGLAQRFEAPDSKNRWDSPLFYLMSDTSVPLQDIYEALFCRKPPLPNQSTQCAPLSDTNFLYELDITTQDVISCIMDQKKMNMEGEIKIPGSEECFILSSERNTTLPELLRLKRQFLSYVKSQPNLYNYKHMKKLFVQYLNTNM